MATKKAEGVTVMLQKDTRNNREPLPVIINGVKYMVERGKPVTVPAEVAEVIQSSMEQDGITMAYIQKEEKNLAKAQDEGAI